jgi:hypothetical protein
LCLWPSLLLLSIPWAKGNRRQRQLPGAFLLEERESTQPWEEHERNGLVSLLAGLQAQ